MNNNLNLNILKSKALHSFNSNTWNEISKYCNGKSGIYVIVNNINGNFYIGSAHDINKRLRKYFQISYLTKHTSMNIVRAINKYGIDSFTILIVEFTDADNLISLEQSYLDQYMPTYNMQKKARPVYTTESRRKARLGRKGEANSFFGKTHTEETKAKLKLRALARPKSHKEGFEVEVFDTLTGTTTTYPSYRRVAKRLQRTHGTISKYRNLNDTLFRNRYLFTINKSK